MVPSRVPEPPHPAARQLLQLCAFLAPAEFPIDALRSGSAELDEPLRDQLDEALAAFGGVPPTLDPAARTEIQRSLDEETTEATVAAGVRCLARVFPVDQREPNAADLAETLLPHAVALTDRDEALLRAPRQTADLWNAMGLFHHPRQALAMARECFERAVRARVSLFGPTSPWVAISLQNLGAVLEDQGELLAAERVLTRAHELDRHHYGLDHAELLWSQRALASVQHRLGRHAQARELLEQASAIAQHRLPDDDPRHRAIQTDIVEVLRALAEQLEGDGSRPEAATTWRARSQWQDRLGDLGGADESFLRALQIEDEAGDGTAAKGDPPPDPR